MKLPDLFALFKPKKVPIPPRTVHVNEGRQSLDNGEDVAFCSNQVITAKYTVLTFLPLNLLEQFKRFVNFYFLLLVIIQLLPQFRLASPGVVVIPLTMMLGFKAAKDAYEDRNRHRLDRRVNHSLVEVLKSGSWINPNPTKPKSEPFVKRFLPNRMMGRGFLSTADSDAETEALITDPDAPHWEHTLWEDLRVGDFVKINENDAIPADILICATSDEENVAYVETKSLDGETNLKSRNAVSPLTHLCTPDACADPQNAFHVKCDKPDVNMYRLNTVVELGYGEQRKFPADLQAILLRGTVLRNTSWVIGVVLFTGNDTKIVLNAGATPSKTSKIERQMGPLIAINLALVFTMATVCAIADSFLEKEYYPLDAPWLYGATQSDDNPNINGFITFFHALLTFQALVPIALYLILESAHTIQSIFIFTDKDIHYDKKDLATQARNWNLTDELGQIEYIFSDKTGTLTQNIMVFRQCTIGHKVYKGDSNPNNEQHMATEVPTTDEQSRTNDDDDDVYHFYDSDLHADITSATASTEDTDPNSHAHLLHGFFSVLSLCHTALASVNSTTGVIEYKAQSPDEAALVRAAADMGYVFSGKEKEVLSLKLPNGQVEKYELLNILDFNSARKRMSVIVRKMDDQDGGVLLLCKGADNVIFERLADGGEELKQAIERHLDDFADEGLRTLTLAHKIIPDDDYEAWAEKYHEAAMAIDDREIRIEALSEEIEKDLHLLGATGIEDKLQDGVPETIADLKRAGIKVWVATGDKMETTIAIGRSTNLISPDSNIIIVRGGSKPVQEQLMGSLATFFPGKVPETVTEEDSLRTSSSSQPGLHRVNTMSSIVGQGNGERPGGYILVIDGGALLQALETEENRALLLQLGTLCNGVICCRVSPLQKALVVRLVKDSLKVTTLAIGDGANDVSMIQAADVGVGILGEEGLQAVNSSDYAIAQFRFLKKLLLVHGHWSYYRIASLILVFFYKNTVPSGVSWWYQIYCGWSATFGFDYLYILFWNAWTATLPNALGLVDYVLDEQLLMDLPELYRYSRERTYFSFRAFCIDMLDGVYQSVIIFFFTMLAYDTTSTRNDGYNGSFYERSTTAALSAVTSVTLFTAIVAMSWTWTFVSLIFTGAVVVWLYTLIGSTSPSNEQNFLFYGNYFYVLTSAPFWLVLVLLIPVTLAPRFIFKAYKTAYTPTDIDIVRVIKKQDPHRDLRDLSGDQDGIGLTEMRKQPRAPQASSRSRRFNLIASRFGTAFARSGSTRVDMSTGLASTDRGFDFAAEENGTAIRRMQTNLSERRMTRRGKKPWFSALKKGYKER
ncbi:phospholipid-translocating atpase [Moniliophthora roreri]|uniref:Phospholipid-transporting ATPase n=1 Tax=Moniliophthora roreri TaxID=221103 RepID=A0A0W0FRK8_MONRR|nr:phospholipid-translocating atpase [Moniliophthora roreri]